VIATNVRRVQFLRRYTTAIAGPPYHIRDLGNTKGTWVTRCQRACLLCTTLLRFCSRFGRHGQPSGGDRRPLVLAVGLSWHAPLRTTNLINALTVATKTEYQGRSP